MDFTPKLALCATCRPRSTSPTSYCIPCIQALEAEIESYWIPLINDAQADLAVLHQEMAKFEATYQDAQNALTERQRDLEGAGRKGSTTEMLEREVMERMYIYADVKMEMEGKRDDLERQLRMHNGGFARELSLLRQSQAGAEEGARF